MAEYWQLNIASWNLTTDDMSLELEAALLRVIHAIRLYDKPIKVNYRVLSGIWRCNERKAKRLLRELCETGEIVVEDGLIINPRAVEEASKYRQLRVDRASSGRQGGIESGKSRRKSLKDKDVDEADASTIKEKKRREEKEEESDGDDAGAREPDEIPDPPPKSETEIRRERILVAMGHDPSGQTADGRIIGKIADMRRATAWQEDLGLTLDEILEVIREVVTRKGGEPPCSFNYFDKPMALYAGQKNAPKLTPIEGGKSDVPATARRAGPGTTTSQARAVQGQVAGFARALDQLQKGRGGGEEDDR